MALIVHFSPKGLTEATYSEVMRRLDAAGATAPKGRLYHTSYGDKNALQVIDIYDTQASFEAFGKTLMPILNTVGVDVGKPDLSEVHNIVRG